MERGQKTSYIGCPRITFASSVFWMKRRNKKKLHKMQKHLVDTFTDICNLCGGYS